VIWCFGLQVLPFELQQALHFLPTHWTTITLKPDNASAITAKTHVATW